jgi:hypothetical protein
VRQHGRLRTPPTDVTRSRRIVAAVVRDSRLPALRMHTPSSS